MSKFLLPINLVTLIVVLIITLLMYHRSTNPSGASDFVTRSDAQLMLDGKPFRFFGANIYWLGLDENVGGVAYPTHFRIDDVLAAAQAMGITVVRAHTLGTSQGCQLCVEPALGKFNETAFQHIDYAIKSAHEHGIRLIIPLTDNWNYYHGGKHTFTSWRGLTDEDQFYTNATVINDFEQYISHLLNHVNSYTGLAYKDDPTILAWETGNEINPPVSWTSTIADYLKKLDPQHLVLDGTKGVNVRNLALSSVDIYSNHYYPMSVAALNSDASTVKDGHKVFIVGEYNWTGRGGGDKLNSFLAGVEASTAAGDMFWSLFGHNDAYGYVKHLDGYTVHYPGDTPDMRASIQLFRTHAYRMRRSALPALSVPGTAQITSVGNHQLTWRGTALADTYTIERSSNGVDGPWTVICDRCATDNDTPWIDKTMPAGKVFYRIKAYNLTGQAGDYSPVAETPSTTLKRPASGNTVS
ncbi:hypothetical protein EPA93_21045 [Ktedonosporobacter rubrisoli]|uniref:mannan endo-1,4-beta-mannosidase n=1 Tax=Ktedonosporobacter rubrisoli TaxID=2509675 RepID=A0A4P6JSV4_KTERU|nr:cellulase family glycosylhydrolase [Ktedonosporobacter rubrisoli]QBD78350.1 hypothetical protein EPA93_21045 [Ktedonosporobacter rubrisoli]